MNLATEIGAELWSAVRRSYESQAWSNAILDAIHHFSDVVRLKSGLQSDGTALAGQAFGGKEPKIRLSRLATESEKNIQAGVEQLVRGLYQAVRNPRSHERFEDTQRECDALIVFIDYLLGVTGHAKAAFSVDEVLSRITDENFVANKRYAELILVDVPRTKRLDTLIAAFEQRDSAKASKQKHFFQACIATLEDAERDQFFEVVSSDLRISTDERELRTVFQILEPAQWLLLSEADRMRSEDRVIRSIEAGRYSTQKQKCLSGGLATWANGFMTVFTLKREVMHALHTALSSNLLERQDYVFKFFFGLLAELAEAPPPYLIRRIREGLDQGDARFRDAVESYQVFGPEAWVSPFQEHLDNFKSNDQALLFSDDFDDEDIPF